MFQAILSEECTRVGSSHETLLCVCQGQTGTHGQMGIYSCKARKTFPVLTDGADHMLPS